MTLPIEWGDLDRALFLLDDAERALAEYGASANSSALALLEKHAETVAELRRQYVESNDRRSESGA